MDNKTKNKSENFNLEPQDIHIIRNIPINKGNYSSFETKEREELFEKHKGEDWEDEYKGYRSDWSKFPKKQFVNDYPLLVDIELSALCNLHCPMCYTITDDFKEKVSARNMDFDLFKKIIDEIGGKVPAIRLSLRGEPTLNKNFIECIRYAKEKGIKEVSTLTHGKKLEPKYFKKMVDAGIDWITVSIDGLDDEYEKIRHPLKFKDTLRRITQMQEYKTENGLKKPVVKIQSLWPAIRKNPSDFYNTFEPISDLIAFNPLIDYLQKDSNIKYIDNFVCPQLYQRLVIGADGSAMMCSNDEENEHVLGDVNNVTVYSIWHSKALNDVREMHLKQDGFKGNSVCRKCYLPREVESGEVSDVNGRDFHILNYVNRPQNLGD